MLPYPGEPFFLLRMPILFWAGNSLISASVGCMPIDLRLNGAGFCWVLGCCGGGEGYIFGNTLCFEALELCFVILFEENVIVKVHFVYLVL